MLKSLDQTKARLIRQEMENALKVISAKHGVHIDIGNGSYSSTHYSAKVTVAVKDEETGIKLDTQRAITAYGLPLDIIGKTFSYKKNSYQIKDISIGGKYPVSCERQDGRGFNLTLGMVKTILGI